MICVSLLKIVSFFIPPPPQPSPGNQTTMAVSTLANSLALVRKKLLPSLTSSAKPSTSRQVHNSPSITPMPKGMSVTATVASISSCKLTQANLWALSMAYPTPKKTGNKLRLVSLQILTKLSPPSKLSTSPTMSAVGVRLRWTTSPSRGETSPKRK